MRKLFIFILSFFFLFGCKTVKNNVRETYTERKEEITEKKEIVVEKEAIQIIENRSTDEFENTTENITVIKFSTPDTAGVQFVVEKMTIERKTNKSKKDVSVTELEAEKQAQTSMVETSLELTDINAEKIDKTIKKVESPAWITWSAILIAIGLIVAMFISMKKYKII